MPFRLAVTGIPETTARIRSASSAIPLAAKDTVNLAARAAGQEAVVHTAGKYNLSEDALQRYVSVDETPPDAATITLRIRAVPLEDFSPQVVMKKFTFTDSRGRHVSRLLPAIYFSRLRGGKQSFLRVAFPLVTRTSGALQPGDVIRRRIGSDRRKLTRIRFYTFPSTYLKGDLVPHLQETLGDVAGVNFRGSFRKRNGTLRQV